MTMLDRMRRHKAWLKWSLGLVVLTFVVLYIPHFLGPNQSESLPGGRLATIDSQAISVSDFQRRYRAQVQAYRSSYGGKVTEEVMQQIGVPQQVLQQMIQEKAELTEAQRAGITVSDAEVRAQIMASYRAIGSPLYSEYPLCWQLPRFNPKVNGLRRYSNGSG